MTRVACTLLFFVAGCAARSLPIVGSLDGGGGGGSSPHDLAVPRDGSVPHDGGVPIVDLAHFPADLTSVSTDMALSAAPCLTGGSVVHLDGDPSDYIFSGVETDQVVTWSPINGDADTFWYECSPGGWAIAFSANQLGQPLAVGRYDNAMRHPFESPGRPGLDIFGNGRGCNTVSGWFEILSISGGPANNNFSELTAVFEHHCEGGAPALRGCIHFEN